jgi:hypothetical protein
METALPAGAHLTQLRMSCSPASGLPPDFLWGCSQLSSLVVLDVSDMSWSVAVALDEQAALSVLLAQAPRLTELSVLAEHLTELPACIAAYQGLKTLRLHFYPSFVDPNGPYIALYILGVRMQLLT